MKLLARTATLFHGRADNQIKHIGHQIELGEIEIAAASINGVTECAVIFDQEKSLICLFHSGCASQKDLAIKLRSQLPSHMIPRKFVQMDSLPRMFNGKIDLQKLRSMW